MTLNDINLYRITHIENIQHVLNYGITHRTSIHADPNFVKIGDVHLINFRDEKIVEVNNGILSSINPVRIRLGNFIPFYFGVRMPMLYTIQKGGNFVEQVIRPEDIIYLVCSLKRIIDQNLDFYFSDGHATNEFTFFYDKTQLNRLTTIIDWQCITSKYWGGDVNLNVKRKKQAELLVAEDVPDNTIIGFGCYNESAKERLIEMGVEENKIKIIPDCYY